MKNNIILLYIIYFIMAYLLFIIDIAVLMYYLFWLNNIFINPLIWLSIKIVYYNRTILLLLIFYYFIAKYTIKESGYKYFYFFNIDIKKSRSAFFDYVRNLTIYHIEMFSIFLFFFVIFLPFFSHNKNLFFLIFYIIIFLFILWRAFKNRLKYVKDKKIRIRSFVFYFFFIIIFLKIFNYQYIKDLYTMYFYLDKWTFELLEWKIQMYNKVMEKDYYTETIGLKPIWVGDKMNKKDYLEKKNWEYLSKKKYSLFKELKYKYLRTKYKYYLYNKYIEHVEKVKTNKINKLRKEFLFKVDINKEEIEIKDFVRKIKKAYENPVVTQEKEKERFLHSVVIQQLTTKLSLQNYYRLNSLLNDLTLSQLYYQSFIDTKGIDKQKMVEKRSIFLLSAKDSIVKKDDLIFYNKIVNKIKNDIRLINKLEKEFDFDFNVYNIYNFFSDKILDYLIIEKKKGLLDFFLKLFKEEGKKRIYKKNVKLNIEKFLINSGLDIKKKEKIDKITFFYKSKNSILDKDKLGKKKLFYSFSNYMDKNEAENFNNKILFNTVKKYNEGQIKENLKDEFSDFLTLKENKKSLTVKDSPDLSRRNKR